MKNIRTKVILGLTLLFSISTIWSQEQAPEVKQKSNYHPTNL